MSAGDYQAGVSGLAADDACKQALMDRDAKALASLLGGRDQMRCAIMVPD